MGNSVHICFHWIELTCHFVRSCAEVYGEGVSADGLVTGVHAAFARHHRPPARQALFQDPKECQGLSSSRLDCGSWAPPRRLPHSLETSVHRERAQLEDVDRDMPVPYRRRGTIPKSVISVCTCMMIHELCRLYDSQDSIATIDHHHLLGVDGTGGGRGSGRRGMDLPPEKFCSVVFQLVSDFG